MNRSYSKIRHIQEVNKKLDKQIISERKITDYFKSVIKEEYLPKIEPGDELCDIMCFKKQAKYGSEGEVVKIIQNGLVNCGFNTQKQGGGMIEGCKTDYKKCDGKFLEETKKAVEEFQKKHNLRVDGAVGVATLTKLVETKCVHLDRDCDCKEERKKSGDDTDDTIREDSKWWTLIEDGDSTLNNCGKINRCLYKMIKNKKFNQDSFIKCMRYKKETPPAQSDSFKKSPNCLGCPQFDNRMPGASLPLNPSDKQFIDDCVRKGCTRRVV
jgi:hypothetical protein